jgi:integrase
MKADIYAPQKITLALIRRLTKASAPDKPREIRDKGNHLILRHQPTSYLGLYVELGRGKRERLCDARKIADQADPLTLGVVKKRAQILRGDSAGGRDFKAERAEAAAIPTLDQYLKSDGAYAAWLEIHHSSSMATLGRLKTRFPELIKKHLDNITPATLEPWKARRVKEVTRETINRDIAALRAALGRAVKLGTLAQNPLAGVDLMKVDSNKQVVRALTAGEKKSLLVALIERDDKKRAGRASGNQWRTERGYTLKSKIGKFADVLTPAVIVSLETGLRSGELFALQWRSVDLKEKTLRVEGDHAKSYQTRTQPLNKTALRTLRDWWLQQGQPKAGYVFSVNDEQITSLKKSYYSVLSDADISRHNEKGERVVWHSLRHTFGTLLGAANVDPTTLMKLMGHANLSTTQRYLHTDAGRKAEAVKALEVM